MYIYLNKLVRGLGFRPARSQLQSTNQPRDQAPTAVSVGLQFLVFSYLSRACVCVCIYIYIYIYKYVWDMYIAQC